MSSGGKKAQTIGYHYFFSLLAGISRGPLDYLKAIKVGDKEAWIGSTSGSLEIIDKPELFGGEKKEGGVQGPFRLFNGDAGQVLPGASPVFLPPPYGGTFFGLFTSGGSLPNVKTSLGGLVSEFRGAALLWFDGLVTSMNPYPKEWKFRVVRRLQGWSQGNAWYPSKAAIDLSNDAMSVDVTSTEIDLEYNANASSASLTFTGNGNNGNTITINGSTITLVDSGANASSFEVNIGATGNITAQRVHAMIMANQQFFNVVAVLGGNVIGLGILVGSGSIAAMNGAHIIYECCTNPEWGRGLPHEMMDGGVGETFRQAADTLYFEGFGLCLAWYRKEEIDVFIKSVVDHIGAVLYTDRRTGKICLKLIRADYEPQDLRLFSPSNGLLSIDTDDSAASDASYNECIVTGHDPVTNQDIQARAHNLAARQAQGSASTLDSSYPGLPTVRLCGRVAQRDLAASASGLKKFTVRLDRRAFDIIPGSVFRLSHPKYGIDEIVVRAGEIDDGDMINGSIVVKCVQDVFGLPTTAFTTPVSSSWQPPNLEALPPVAERLFELDYRQMFRLLPAGELAAVLPGDAYVGVVAAAPTVASLQFDLLVKAQGEPNYRTQGSHAFTGAAVLNGAISATATSLVVRSATDLPEDMIGDVLMIGDELMRVDAFNPTTMTFTVARGAVDTFPTAHLDGAAVFFPDDDLGSDNRAYAEGETIYAKVLTRTSSDLLTEAEATELQTIVAGRQGRPYPPANQFVNGVTVLDNAIVPEMNEPVVTWATRNRISQQDQLVGYFEASVAPEVGQSYTVRVYTQPTGGTLLRTETNVTSPWTYTTAMQTADSAPRNVFVELVAVRDGIESWRPRRYRAKIDSGYGFGYGFDYGGS